MQYILTALYKEHTILVDLLLIYLQLFIYSSLSENIQSVNKPWDVKKGTCIQKCK